LDVFKILTVAGGVLFNELVIKTLPTSTTVETPLLGGGTVLSAGSPLCGIVPPMVTPLRDRDALDADGLERLIEHVVAGRGEGLFYLCTSG
jgi:hypothetical protein